MNKVCVVGIGPGSAVYMTEQARAALDGADVLCGYTVYVELVREMYPEKEIFTTPMCHELERCRAALEMAAKGLTVAVICSGDAGVYGMAAPLLELAENYPDVELEIVPGVTAALSGAAVLGAPLGHDFCVISLSDLLTPWPVIEKRLRAAAAGDFCVCLYNPASRKRTEHLKNACDILMDAGKSLQTPCGWARNVGRPGQESRTLTLGQLREETPDMFTTVFIGNNNTVIKDGRLVTPRGYLK